MVLKPAAGNRIKITPGNVFFTWDITYDCNYECSYCSLGNSREKQENTIRKRILSPDMWFDIWKGIYERYGSCQIHLTGGEPFTYPGIMDILERIVKIHTVECSSNLCWDVDKFISIVPSKYARVGTSYHPEMTEFDSFFEKVVKLRRQGFIVWISYVAYPPFIDDLETVKNLAVSNDIEISIIPFNGEYNGRRYPAGYDDRERKILSSLGMGLPAVEKAIDWAFKAEKRIQTEKLCRMGQMYAKIHPDGSATRCCSVNSPSLGNIIDGTFSLLEDPQPCRQAECPCWKCMIVGDERTWGQHWPAPAALIEVKKAAAYE